MFEMLPFNFDVINSTDCVHSKLLGITLSDKKNYAWYVEKFIDVFISLSSSGFYTGYYKWGSDIFNGLYNDVLDIRRSSQYSIEEEIEDLVEKQEYLYFDVDYYYIKESKEYKKNHKTHDCLILGVDNEKNSVSYIDFNINNVKFGIHTMTVSELISANMSAAEINRGDFSSHIIGMPFCKIKIKKSEMREVNSSKILYELINYSMGEVRQIEHTNLLEYCDGISRKGWDKRFKEWHGISIYDGIRELIDHILFSNELLSNTEMYSITRLEESKKILLWKIQYLISEKVIKSDAELLSIANKLVNTLEQMKNHIFKYNFKKNSIELYRAYEKVYMAKELDVKVCNMLICNIYSRIKSA